MLVKSVKEYFSPAQHMHKIMYLERRSTSSGKSVRSCSSFFSETEPSKVWPLLCYILWIFWEQVSGHVSWAQVYSICGSICRIKEGIERKRTDSSANFSEATTQKGFSWHVPQHSPIMFLRGISWEQVIPNAEKPYSSPCLTWIDVVKEVGLKALC